MVALLFAVLLAQQQLWVDATIDRDQVTVGETVLLTITVETTGNDPVQIVNPSLVGLELLGTTERSDVSILEGVAARILTRTLRLRASAAGTGRIGTVMVRSGELLAQADPIELIVVAGDHGGAETLAPHILDLVDRHVPPQRSAEEVYLAVLTSKDSVVLGEQIDLAVVAWFPQAVRTRLRAPPTLRPPELQGAWTYNQRVPHAVDVRRRVRNVWYNVYVHSVAVFPLTPGTLDIGPATVSYSLPMSYSFLNREVRHELQSTGLRVYVRDQTAEARPAAFDGAVSSGLELEMLAAPTVLPVGDAAVVTAVLRGEGNVALWPEPRVQWPYGVRTYPEGAEVELIPDAERITGRKTFRYLLVPDSAGEHLIGPVTYAYYDLRERRYVNLRAPQLVVIAEAAVTASAERRAVTRPLMEGKQGATIERLFESIPAWILLLFLAIPPLAVGIFRAIPYLRTLRVAKVRVADGELHRVETVFHRALGELVGDATRRSTHEVATALRAAGIDAPIAAHAARVRERLWQSHYGSESEIDPDELAAEVGEMLKALTGEAPRTTNRARVGTILTLLCLAATPLAVSGQSAERLCEAGALRASADSFAARASEDPWAWAHWYNLGAAYERAGELQRARRAWLRAARLAPRDSRIRSALRQLPPPDAVSRKLLWISPVSPAEAFSTAALLWVLTWIGFALRVNKRWWITVCFLAIVCGGFGRHLTGRYAAPVALVLSDGTVLRAAPYGPAQAQRILDEGIGLRVMRETGAWLFVKRGGDAGWLLRDEVVALR